MLFSIVIPAHNEEKDIGECLKRLMNQNCEILVVNDGSTDDTEKIARDYGVKVINFTKSHSASFARNRGAERAKGKYLIFIDADMIVPKDFIEKVKSYLPFDCLTYRVLSYKPKTIFQRAWSTYRKKIEKHGAEGCFHCVRKKMFEKVKGYDENIFYFEDFDLKERILKLNPKYKISNIIVYHKDVKNFKDFIRQRKWHGKGIFTLVTKKRKLYPLKHFVPCFFFHLLPVYLLICWIIFYKDTKEVINSFLWVSLDYIGRFISLFYFIKLMLSGREL